MNEIPDDIAEEVLRDAGPDIRALIAARTKQAIARRQSAEAVAGAAAEVEQRAAKLSALLADPTASRRMLEEELRLAVEAGKRMKGR